MAQWRQTNNTMIYTLIITQFVSRLKKWMCTLCNKCVRCASVVVRSVKKFNMGIINFLSVDLKSLPLAECQFESGRGHHAIYYA